MFTDENLIFIFKIFCMIIYFIVSFEMGYSVSKDKYEELYGK